MSRWLAFALAAANGAVALGAVAFLVLSWDAPVPDAWGVRGYAAFHAVAFTIQFPQVAESFQGHLFSGDGKAIAGTSKLQDREAGFYAVREE